MSAQTLSKDKIFDTHFGTLKEAEKSFVDAHQKMFIILSAVIAWFVGKDNPLVILCGDQSGLAYFAIGCTIAGFFGLTKLFDVIYKRGEIAFYALKLESYPTSLYEGFRITSAMRAWGFFGQYLLLLGIALLITKLYVVDSLHTCKLLVSSS